MVAQMPLRLILLTLVFLKIFTGGGCGLVQPLSAGSSRGRAAPAAGGTTRREPRRQLQDCLLLRRHQAHPSPRGQTPIPDPE